MASQRTAKAVSCLNGAYTTLFSSQSKDPTQTTGTDMWGLEIWAVTGSSVLKINGVIVAYFASTDTAHKYFFSKGETNTFNLIECAGDGVDSTVSYNEI